MSIFCLPPLGPKEGNTSFCVLLCTVSACLSVRFMGVKAAFLAWMLKPSSS